MDRLALPSHSVTKANRGSATFYKVREKGKGEGSSLFFGRTSLLLTQAGHSHNLAAGTAGRCRVTATLVPGRLDEGESGWQTAGAGPQACLVLQSSIVYHRLYSVWLFPPFIPWDLAVYEDDDVHHWSSSCLTSFWLISVHVCIFLHFESNVNPLTSLSAHFITWERLCNFPPLFCLWEAW